jgi:hypothetical protein
MALKYSGMCDGSDAGMLTGGSVPGGQNGERGGFSGRILSLLVYICEGRGITELREYS